MDRIITYGLYPFLLTSTLIGAGLTLYNGWEMTFAYSVMAGARFAVLIALEFLMPCRREWKMTWRSFFRDIKFGAANTVVIRGLVFGLALLAIDLSEANAGFFPEAPLIVGLLATALVFEFIQYWFHRFCHEGKGALGHFLWKMHAAHHLPSGVYMIMHAVMHPINAISGFMITRGSIILLGASQESIFLLLSLTSLHALISHYNVNIRAGVLNYIFIGTELHRYHHSADFKEGKNYGALLSIWDIVFGTFVYRPGRLPKRLGVDKVKDYPKSTEWAKVVALPFRKAG